MRLILGNMGALKPGVQIFIVARQKMADGTLTASAINDGRDGDAPPMSVSTDADKVAT